MQAERIEGRSGMTPPQGAGDIPPQPLVMELSLVRRLNEIIIRRFAKALGLGAEGGQQLALRHETIDHATLSQALLGVERQSGERPRSAQKVASFEPVALRVIGCHFDDRRKRSALAF